MASHDERLRVPGTWWPIVAAIVVLGVLEIGSGFSYVVLVPVAIFLIGFFVVPLVLAGRERIELRDGVIHAGKQELSVTQITKVEALDRAQTRLRLGPQGDPAAHLVVRGWVGTAVVAWLANPHPVPYWILSTRHPEELAAAIKTARLEARAAKG